MLNENSFVFDDWHPVGALADTSLGKKYFSRVLAVSIEYTLTEDGLRAEVSSTGLPLKTKVIYGLLWALLQS